MERFEVFEWYWSLISKHFARKLSPHKLTAILIVLTYLWTQRDCFFGTYPNISPFNQVFIYHQNSLGDNGCTFMDSKEPRLLRKMKQRSRDQRKHRSDGGGSTLEGSFGQSHVCSEAAIPLNLLHWRPTLWSLNAVSRHADLWRWFVFHKEATAHWRDFFLSDACCSIGSFGELLSCMSFYRVL